MLGKLICKIKRKHAMATMEFHGAKASDRGEGDFGEPSIAVYKVTCPRCGASVLVGWDEIVEDIARALELEGRYKDIVRLV